MGKVILSIDQSYTSSGYVVFVDGEIMDSGLVSSDKTLDIFERAWNSANTLLNVAKQWKPDVVTLEGLAFGMRGSATRDLAGLQFILVTKMRFEGKFKVNILAPLTVKKFATGSGKADKKKMFEALPQKIKDNFVQEKGYKKTKGLYDVVDAYFIGKTAIDLINKGKL